MARGLEPAEFIPDRTGSKNGERTVVDAPRSTEPQAQEREERLSNSGSQASLGLARPPKARTIYEVRNRTYRLRPAEITTMIEIGKFRAVAVDDLRDHVYNHDRNALKPHVENLIRQGLVQMKSVPHEERGSRQLVALTKPGYRLLTELRFPGQNQALYSGFANPREADHDANLYRLYQKAASKIARAGGRNLRVVLDYELKKRVYHDLAKLGPQRNQLESRQSVAEGHGLQVVRGKIPLPDLRIEYETLDGERARVDLELATSHYRGRTLAQKVRAGFSIYAKGSDAAHLRRVLDQRELTAEILSL